MKVKLICLFNGIFMRSSALKIDFSGLYFPSFSISKKQESLNGLRARFLSPIRLKQEIGGEDQLKKINYRKVSLCGAGALLGVVAFLSLAGESLGASDWTDLSRVKNLEELRSAVVKRQQIESLNALCDQEQTKKAMPISCLESILKKGGNISDYQCQPNYFQIFSEASKELRSQWSRLCERTYLRVLQEKKYIEED